jgi:WD40 repeat protein
MNKLMFIFVLLFFATTALAQSQIIGDSTDIVWEKYYGGDIYDMTFSPNDSLIATGKVLSINILSKKTGEFLQNLSGNSTFWCVRFSPDGKFLASINRDGYLRIWNTNDWKIVFSIRYENEFMTNIEFSKDGKYLALSANVFGLIIYNTSDWSINTTITDFPYYKEPKFGGTKKVDALDFNPDGTKIVFSGDWTFVYDLAAKTIIKKYNGLVPKYSPDGKYIANKTIGSSNNYLQIYNTLNDSLEINIPMGNNNFDYSFSADGKYIATSSDRGFLKIYNIKNNSLEYIFEYKIPSALKLISFSNDLKNMVLTNGLVILLKYPFLKTDIKFNENTNKTYFSISPNPASDYIFVSHAVLDAASIEIYNIFGEKNPSQTLPVEEGTGIVLPNGKDIGGVFKIDVSNLVPGVYFIRIGDRFEKFIKW